METLKNAKPVQERAETGPNGAGTPRIRPDDRIPHGAAGAGGKSSIRRSLRRIGRNLLPGCNLAKKSAVSSGFFHKCLECAAILRDLPLTMRWRVRTI
jgi:hypothetical protein